MKKTITLRELRDSFIEKDMLLIKTVNGLGGWKEYGLDTPITPMQILDIHGMNDTILILCVSYDMVDFCRVLACDFAERAVHIFEEIISQDLYNFNKPILSMIVPKIPRAAIKISRLYAKNMIDYRILDIINKETHNIVDRIQFKKHKDADAAGEAALAALRASTPGYLDESTDNVKYLANMFIKAAHSAALAAGYYEYYIKYNEERLKNAYRRFNPRDWEEAGESAMETAKIYEEKWQEHHLQEALLYGKVKMVNCKLESSIMKMIENIKEFTK